MKSRLKLPLILIVILAVASLVLLVPSSRGIKANQARAKLKLVKKFDPVKLQKLERGHVVSMRSPSGRVASPTGKFFFILTSHSTMSSEEQILNSLAVGSAYSGTALKRLDVLLAPEASSTSWSLFAKLWIAQDLLSQNTQPTIELGTELAARLGGTKPLTALSALWATIPPNTQKKAEEFLDQNRKIATASGSRRLYDAGDGVIYDIDISDNIFEFKDLIERVEPSRPTAR